MALVHHSRARFMQNLMPLLRASTSLRRIVTVFTGTKEGPIIVSDFQGRNIPLLATRGHGSSILTLSLEALAAMTPDVSFIHCFRGPVKTNIGCDVTGMMLVMKAVFTVIGPIVNVPIEESRARHLFLAASAKYPASVGAAEVAGVPLAGAVAVAVGTDGKAGSGVYSINMDGESAGTKAVELLAKLRKEEMVEKMWEHTEGEIKRIAGSEVT
jgi:hypothetical protein